MRLLIVTGTEPAIRGDEGAIAALMAVCMALRASEILSREMEAVDDEGTSSSRTSWATAPRP